jgi:hypothetical protein
MCKPNQGKRGLDLGQDKKTALHSESEHIRATQKMGWIVELLPIMWKALGPNPSVCVSEREREREREERESFIFLFVCLFVFMNGKWISKLEVSSPKVLINGKLESQIVNFHFPVSHPFYLVYWHT